MSDSTAYSSTGNKSNLDRAYALQSPAEARTLYNEWASTYDAELSELEYVFHRHAASAVLNNLEPSQLNSDVSPKVLDAGCGTGLVAVALHENLPKSRASNVKFEIDGVDISPGMLDVARRTGLYASLSEADLTTNRPISCSDGHYDVVVCVGTLTRGHVGSSVLSEFVRITKSGGLIVATVLEEIWQSKEFDVEVKKLKEDNMVDVLSLGQVGVVKGKDQGGRLVVLRRI